MPLNISTYVDPGVYVAEVVVPGAVSVTALPLTVCLVGAAKRDKRASNEAVQRGLISNESLTFAATPGAHDVTLINLGNRNTAQTTVTKDGVALDSADVSYLPASKTGLAFGASLDFTAPNNKLALSLDGKAQVTIAITGLAGGDLTTVTNGLITQNLNSVFTGGGIAAVTPSQIAEGINKALAGATSLYGAAYGAVATVDTGKVVVTSPLSTSASNVTIYAAFPTVTDSQSDAVFDASLTTAGSSVTAPTILRISDAAYDTGLFTFEGSYVSTNSDLDTLSNASVNKIVKVGSFAGVTSFTKNVDFTTVGDDLDWDSQTAATFTSSIASATFDVDPEDTILLSVDGKVSLSMDLNGLASPPPGYANPSVPAAATLAELTNNINAILANSAAYGPEYATVASVDSSRIKLTSPKEGTGSIIDLAAPATNDAITILFGLSSSQLPFSVRGSGTEPTPGTVYFVTYEYTRPAADYNAIKRFFTPDALYADVGLPSATNKLAIAGQIAFDNGAPSVAVVQVNDSNFPGSPTTTEMDTAITAAGNSAVPTEIIALDTRLVTQTNLLSHVVNQNSPTIKNYRRGWFGMAAGTLIGDRDTVDTFVYRATRTLQVPGDSPGRGRLILVAPSQADRTITLEDGSETTLTLDGTFLAVAVASLMTSFTSPSETLLRKNIKGFSVDTFPTFLRTERALLASNGVTLVTQDAGRLTLLDPISTEAGGGKVVTFQEISASTQKDSVTTAVQEVVESNLVGIVPADIDIFLAAVKGFIGGALRSLIASGAIGPFKSDEGITRDIDFSKDIQVTQDKTDQTKFFFKFFFNLRLPAKRFFGEFSVNNPFF